MPSTGDIASRMIAALRLAEPNLDTGIGTPIRKILDTVSESIAEAYTDSHLINYQYDIDSKIGGDLDDFVALFGFSRIPPQRAQGTVTFSRPSDATTQNTAVVIAPGTQVVALTNPVVYVATTISSVLSPGQLSAEVPVQAVTAGASGNVAAGLLTTPASAVPGITAMTNTQPLTGGSPQESDEQLRARFRQTVFRSLAGTQAMYEGIARDLLQDNTLSTSRAISKVNVIGASKRWREQIQLVGGTATSSIFRAAYIYQDSAICGTDIDNGQFLVPNTNFTFTPNNPIDPANLLSASATLTATTGMPDGLYDLEFEYVPNHSRNDPANIRWNQGPINNRVDIYVNGVIADVATQSITFSNAITFDDVSTSPYYRKRFIRSFPNEDNPPLGHIFIPLSFGQILSIPDTISIGGTVYTEGTDYWYCWQSDPFGYSARSKYGLVWQTTRVPANGAAFSLTYTYNRVAQDLQAAIDNWRLLGTDALAHCGRPIPMRFYLAVVYDRRYTPSSVNTDINTALASYLASLGFDANVQVSDVLNVVHNVAGVDNVRFLTSTDDASNYAMVRMSNSAANYQIEVFSQNGRAIDVMWSNHEYPVLHSTVIVPKAANTFGQY